MYNFEGRYNRAKYFWKMISTGLVTTIIYSIIFNPTTHYMSSWGFGLQFVLFIVQAPIVVKRLHDINHSELFYFLRPIPIVGDIFLIILLFIKGTSGRNKYGEDPLFGINETVTFNERFIEFWHRTWSKWRLGFDSDLEKFADVSFDDFLKSARIDNINLLSIFFDEHKPMQSEFLLSWHYGLFSNKPDFVMTNIRLWIADKTKNELVCHNIKDISDFCLKDNHNWLNADFKIILKDNSEKIYKLSHILSPSLLKIVIDNSRTPDGWSHYFKQLSQIQTQSK